VRKGTNNGGQLFRPLLDPFSLVRIVNTVCPLYSLTAFTPPFPLLRPNIARDTTHTTKSRLRFIIALMVPRAVDHVSGLGFQL